MIPESYWKREDTPMKNSPVGKVMQDLITEYPQLTPHQACDLVHEAFAAGTRTYNQRVYTRLLRAKSLYLVANAKEGHS